MANRMVVIPYEKYIKLINIHKEMNIKKINDIPDDDINDDIKVDMNSDIHNMNKDEIKIDTKNENETKDAFSVSKKQENDSILMSSDVNDMLYEDDIIDHIPKTYRKKCKLLINHMKNYNIKWDSFGRLLLGDECLQDSHIVDMLLDNVRINKKPKLNKNSTDLSKLLVAKHCPKSLLNNE